MSTGIEARHARSCAARRGCRCNCAPTFQAKVYDARSGRRIAKTFNTKSAAKQWRTDAQAMLRRGELIADRGVTLAEATEQWLADLRAGFIDNRSGDRYKPSAIRGYEQNLRLRVLPALGSYRLGEIRPRDVQAFVDAMRQQGLAPATIDAALTPLKAIFRRAVNRGEVASNPTRGIEKPAVRRAPKTVATPAEASAMLEVLDGPTRALWSAAFYAGLRRGELVALRVEDVDVANGRIFVRHGWDDVEGEIAPKSRQGKRVVPVPAALRDDLLDQVLARQGQLRVFESFRAVLGHAARARKRWEEHRLPNLTLHEARHTYASLMIAAGVNVKALSTFMGHANIGITLDLYGHLFPGSETQAAALLDGYLARSVGGATVAHPVAQEAVSP